MRKLSSNMHKSRQSIVTTLKNKGNIAKAVLFWWYGITEFFQVVDTDWYLLCYSYSLALKEVVRYETHKY